MTAFTWALLAAFCWGLAPLLEKAGLHGRIDPALGVFIRSLGVFLGIIGFLPFLPKLSSHLPQVTARQWAFLMLGGILASIVGQLCFYRALKLGEVSRVVPIGAAYPVIACLLGIFFLHESVTPGKALGILLVVAGTLLLK